MYELGFKESMYQVGRDCFWFMIQVLCIKELDLYDIQLETKI